YQCYIPFYLLLIVAHAMDTGARLLLPLLPALLVCVWFALSRLGERRSAVLGVCLAVQLVVGGGYWLGVDLPRARHFDRQWPTVDELAARVTSGAEPDIANPLPHELELMLELALDRPVTSRSARARQGRAGSVPKNFSIFSAANRSRERLN
ncbi:MAG: hypothetical protein ACREHD_12100, partial [Pirellulales bacterium]